MSAAPGHFIHPWRSTGIAFFVGLTLVALTLAAIMLWAGYGSFRRELSGYCHVNLNDSMDEVQYRLGYPPAVLEPEKPTASNAPACRASGEKPCINPANIERIVSSAPGKSEIPADKGIKDYRHWEYGFDFSVDWRATGPNVNVYFDKDSLVARVSCNDYDHVTNITCPPLIGITLGTSEEEVLKTLGKPSQSTITYGLKWIRYDELGLELNLQKGSVIGLALTRRRGGDLALLRSFVARVTSRLL